jgi:membrane protein
MPIFTTWTPEHMKKFITILTKAFANLKRNDPLRLAAATAFFTTFALPAILIILITVLGVILPRVSVRDHLLQHLSDIIGPGTTSELKNTLRNVRKLITSWYIAIGGFIFLVFVSTTLFAVIKASLNQLWAIRKNRRTGVKSVLRQRGKAFLLIVLTGALFLLVILAEGLQALLRGYLNERWAPELVIAESIINQVLSLGVVSFWFAVLFRLLPDGQPTWRVAFTGGLFTGAFFSVGKLALRFLLSYSNMHTIYGASTSMVLLLLFVFYSSFIFYYGAAFTQVWAEFRGSPIELRPGRHEVVSKK